MEKKHLELLHTLYITYSKDLYAIARFRLEDDDAAKDAVQMVFLLAVKKIHILNKHENKKLWLYKTMQNVIKQMLYNKKYTKDGYIREILSDTVREYPYEDQYPFEELGIITSLKTYLKDREYQYLIARFVQDKSNQEIANLFGLSYQGAVSLGKRVLKKIEKILEK